jgi:tricarballylate dehydrogenase
MPDHQLAAGHTIDKRCVRREHEAIKLTLDGEGRVNGVVVRKPDGLLRTITADAVVLASGGFEGNPEMLTQYIEVFSASEFM